MSTANAARRAAELPDPAGAVLPHADRPKRILPFVPGLLIVVPFALSMAVWLLPTSPNGSTGFADHAPITKPAVILIVIWLATIATAGGLALVAGSRRPPLSSLRYVSVDWFHTAACVAGAIGTAWVYWSIIGGNLSTLIHLWENREFSRFREFEFGVGVSTLRYGGVLAGGLSIARLATGARIRRLDVASLVVLIGMVLLNSRLSALMAVSVAVAVIALGPGASRIRPNRILAGVLALAVLFVVANYSRNANNYERVGVTNPITMAALNAQSYVATPAQVTLLVSEAAMDGRLLPPTDPAGAWAPVLPLYAGKRFYASIQADSEPVEARYDGTVDLTVDLTTNGALTDILAVSGWWAIGSAVIVMTLAAWVAGRFAVSGPIGAAIAGAILYGFAEVWRVFIFNTGNMHFIVLLGVVAMAVGGLRRMTGAPFAPPGRDVRTRR